MAICGIAMIIQETAPIGVGVGAALWGVGILRGFPPSVSAAADHATHAPRWVSVATMCGYSTNFAGPPAIGLLGQRHGILTALWLVVAGLAGALVCTPLLRLRR
jgi:hypothetical protein